MTISIGLIFIISPFGGNRMRSLKVVACLRVGVQYQATGSNLDSTRPSKSQALGGQRFHCEEMVHARIIRLQTFPPLIWASTFMHFLTASLAHLVGNINTISL